MQPSQIIFVFSPPVQLATNYFLLSNAAFRFALRLGLAILISRCFVLVMGYPGDFGFRIFSSPAREDWRPSLDVSPLISSTASKIETYSLRSAIGVR
jgi:hypothetical protein